MSLSTSALLEFASDVEFAFTASLSFGIVALLACAFSCRPNSDATTPPRLFQCTSFISTILAAAIVIFASIDQESVNQSTLSWLHRSAVFVWVVSVRVSFGYVCRSAIAMCMVFPLLTEWLRIACIVLYQGRKYSSVLFATELVVTLSQTISVAGVLGWSWLTVNPVNQLFERINAETCDPVRTQYNDEVVVTKYSTSVAGRQSIGMEKAKDDVRPSSQRTLASRKQRGVAGEDAGTQVARTIPLGRGIEVENSTVETRLLTSSRTSQTAEKSIARILWQRWKYQFSALALVRLTYDVLGLLPALLLRPLVDNLAVAIAAKGSSPDVSSSSTNNSSSTNEPLTWQYVVKSFNMVDGRFQSSVVLLCLLVACSLFGTLLRVHYHLKLQKISLYIHGVVADAIYHVSLSRRKYAFGGKSRGDVINYLSVDAQRVAGSVQILNEVWALPVQTCIALYFLYIQLSFAFLTGLVIALLIIPVNVYLAKWIQKVQMNMMLWNDERVLTINEIIKNIVYVKMCGWSPDIEEWVRRPRLEYMMYLRRMKFLDAICVFLWAVTPVLVPLLTFSVYIYFGGQLTPGRTISCLTLFGYLIVPLNAYPWVITGLVEAYVSLCRVQPFLFSSGDEEDGVDSDSDGLNNPRNAGGKEQAPAKRKFKASVLARFGLNRKGMTGSSSQSAGLLDNTDHAGGGAEEELTETESDIGFEEQNELSGQREFGGGVGRAHGQGAKAASRNAKQSALLHGRRNNASGGGAARDSPATAGEQPGNRFRGWQSDMGSSSETNNGGGGEDESVFVYMEQCSIVYRPMTDGFVASKPPSLLCATEISVDVPVLTQTNVFSLYIPHFKASKGQLVAIIGKAGSGKSSFLDAIADECRVAFANRFTVRRDKMAYVEQQPFIVSGSVRQNVLFGRPYQKQRYEGAIRDVCLEDEVEEMPEGDNSHVGHRGSQLSGGQKYRLALARAYYADRDLYLLDEGLGSLDVTVAKAVVANIFVALAKSGKCVIVATHNEELIRAADLVYQCEGGKVSLIGAPSSRPALSGKSAAPTQREGGALAAQPGATAPATAEEETGIPEDEFGNVTEKNKTARDSAISEGGALLEDGERGSITARTVMAYLRKVGVWMCIFVVALIVGMQITRNAGDWYIAERSGEPLTSSSDPTGAATRAATRQLLLALGLVALINGILSLARGFSFAIAGLTAAREMHNDLLRHVLRANYMFFCNTPPGRIINRLSRDVYNVDDGLPFSLNLFLAKLFLLLGSVVVIIANSSWVLLIAILPLCILYYAVQKPYRYANREVRRLELAVRAPMIDNLRDFVDGGVAIRSMGLEVVMGCLRTARTDLNMFLRTEYNSIMLQAWFSLRLEALGVLILVAVGCTTVFYFGTVTNVAMLGLALAYVQPLTSYISSVLSTFTETEKQLISVERMRQYLELSGEEEELNSCALALANNGNVIHAASAQTPTESSRTFTSVTSGQMRYIATTAVWPLFGTIEFCNVSLRYEPSSPLVLRGLSFRVEAGEKIGIVGRTGAGKTSIFSALLRLVQLETGSILIDSDDIGHLAPDSLRARLSILPQNPFTYHGTIRQNLDPFGKHTDDEVAFALQCVEMQYLSPFFVVSEDGNNLSGAQRHLLALARTILQQSCIMLLDEPTSQINKQAEKTLWNVMSTHFRESTILCVTHKMDHIDFFDRILVMNGGELVAQGTPDELRRDRVWPFTHP